MKPPRLTPMPAAPRRVLMACWLARLGAVAVLCSSGVAAQGASRTLPKPLPGHPGNIFLAGEKVVVPVDAAGGSVWRAFDYEDRKMAEGREAGGKLDLGPLPVGWYRLRRDGAAGKEWISLGVIEPLRAPTPRTSPVASDTAMAWFYPTQQMSAVSSLCALAGLNWTRDRLSWGEMEPRAGAVKTGVTRYDASAAALSGAGLRVLQVNHSTPQWANADPKRFPADLRDAYRFYRAMAARWRGKVQAFEPWNEADIDAFGGHTGSEIASMQKASCLGLKAGNPEVIVCQNVFATHRQAQLEDFHDNEAWPYFDTFNLHHYAALDNLPALYSDFRAVSAGRPLWVTECSRPVRWAGDEKLQEPTDADLREQSERVAKTFAASLHEGSAATFYFILGHYVEGQTQFGIIRRDLTPRPAYVALAAVGRLLADAKPLGRLKHANSAVHAYAFRARPDGKSRDVLVAWTTEGQGSISLASPPVAIYDHLGRRRKTDGAQVELATAPVFVVLASARALPLSPPPPQPVFLKGNRSPVVFQPLFQRDKTVLNRSACRVSSEKPERLAVFAYNFGTKPVRGPLKLTMPDGWRGRVSSEIVLAPMERKDIGFVVEATKASGNLVGTVRITGQFGPAGRSVLSFRLMPDPIRLDSRQATPIAGAGNPARWERMISGKGLMRLAARNDGVLVEAEPAGSDRWVYPRYVLAEGERAPAGCAGIVCALTLLEGDGDFRVIFHEGNGAAYVADCLAKPRRGESVEALALFEAARAGHGWSKPDPNNRLDPDQIGSFKIGCNTQGGRVSFVVSNVRWVRF